MASVRSAVLPRYQLSMDRSLLTIIILLTFAVAFGGMRSHEAIRTMLIALTILVGGVYALWTAAMDARVAEIKIVNFPSLFLGFALSLLVANFISGGLRRQTFQVLAVIASTYLFYFLLPRALLFDRTRLHHMITWIRRIAWLNLALVLLALLGVRTVLGIPIVNSGYVHTRFPVAMGFFEHQSILGIFLSITMIMELYNFKISRNINSLYLIFACLSGIVIAQSRESQLATAVALGVFFAPNWFLKSGLRFLTLPLLLGLPIALALQLGEAIPLLGKFLRLQNGLSGREVSWALGLMKIRTAPMFGFGYGSAVEFKQSHAQLLITLGEDAVNAAFHNTYLTYTFDAGVIALVFYLAMFLLPITMAARRPLAMPEKRFLLSISLMIFCSDFWTDNNIGGIRITSFLITVMLGLAYARTRYAESAFESHAAAQSNNAAQTQLRFS